MTATLSDRVEAFEAALQRDPAADPAAFLPPADHPDYAVVLAELLRVDLELAWTRGARRRLADYRPRFPALTGEALQAVAFEEFRQRRLHGEDADPAEYRSAYGVDTDGWAGLTADSGVWGPGTAVVSHVIVPADAATPAPSSAPLSELFAPSDAPAKLSGSAGSAADALRAATASGPPASDPASVAGWLKTGKAFPEVGSQFLGFHLDEELGRGAFGRVYLARQGDLAGRPVAVKLAWNIAGESRTLAQLQHTHIVPIYSFHQAGPLQAVVMPYFGRTTLATVIEKVGGRPSLPSSGRELHSTVDVRAEATVADGRSAPDVALAPAADAAAEGWARLDGLSYVEAVLTLGAGLADGLAHAHARGILHRDLKPANVLLTDEGRPMLLDFNLAEDTKLRGTVDGAAMGGTLPYMSPEQLRAFARPGTPLDARTDVYSLGVVLFELLTGRHPFPARRGAARQAVEALLADRTGRVPSVRDHNPAVSPAAEAIVQKCLAADPADRYQTAAQLRDDLQRQLAHQTLKHAPEPSVRERVRKWGRRHPRLSSATAVATAAGLLLAVTGGGALAARERSRDLSARGMLAEHQAAFRDARLAAGNPDHARPKLDALVASLQGVLDRYGASPDADADGWLNTTAVRYLPAADREHLRGDVGEACLLMAQATGRLARGEADPAAKAARLDRADRLLAAADRHAASRLPKALKQLRADLLAARSDAAGAARLQAEADATPAETARDRFFVAARLFDRGQPRLAVDHLRAATQLDPQDLSAWFLSGVALVDAGQPDLAAASFGACTALKPDHTPAWLNRGVAYTRSRKAELALADFDAALKLDPTNGRALLERANAHLALRRPAEARADFDRVCSAPTAPPIAFFRRAALLRKQGDFAGAAADVAEGFRRECRDPVDWVARSEARLLQAHALAAVGGPLAARRAPHDALNDVRMALALDPDHEPALQQSAHILSEWLGREAEAVAALDRLVAARPQSAPALAGRGVLLARAGDRAKAVRDAKDALLADNAAPVVYQVAGVFARFAPARPEDKREALSLLWSALKTGYGLDLVDRDPDLDPLRADPEFKRVVANAKSVRAALAR